MGNQIQTKARTEKLTADGPNERIVSGEPVTIKDICRFSKSVCKISHQEGSATGFLYQIETASDGEPPTTRFIPGILMNNHVIDEDMICSDTELRIVFTTPEGDEQQYQFLVREDLYWFTCPLLDATFIEISATWKNRWIAAGFKFLIASDARVANSVLILQHAGGNELSFAHHKILEQWGIDFKHTVSTEYGSSGSPVISRNNGGRVVGLHKRRAAGHRLYNVATNMKFVCEAIDHCLSSSSEVPLRGVRRLTLSEIERLRGIGLRELHDDERRLLRNLGYENLLFNMLISPSSPDITEIWFYRSCHFWYWSPPLSEELFNWARISPSDPIQVVGGHYNEQMPANRNIRIIRYLQDNGNSFITWSQSST